MLSLSNLALFVGILASIPSVIAGFNSASQTNIAVYWGQNSYGQGTGAFVQQRLSYYCANTDIDIIPLAFLVSMNTPVLNFANQGDVCTVTVGSTLFYCSELEADITTCQKKYGKTILLSIGGATYTEGGFTSTAAAITAANNVWSWFGPYSSYVVRPFGTAVVDGFDFDFESTVSNMPAFANQLRSLMNANKSKTWLLSAAPQCPYPDAADGPMLNGAVSFDIVWVQFYNNYCGIQSFVAGTATQNNFNFATWDTWAKTISLNPKVKVMLGIPSNIGAGAGYTSGTALANIIAYSKSFSSFGGIMMWDVSQLYANTGFLNTVNKDLGNPPVTVPVTTTTVPVTYPTPPPTTTTTPGSTLTTVTTTSASATSTGGAGIVNEWNQCGGQGWNGGTVCVAGTTCVAYSIWYSQCNPS
ncbi:glycoside hydrolase family 18 protein [Sclerotinia borealis F-4128]|uniref:chitinase n=1 Tax=Sclerotinia borealis (strain F-4128) TaxID=1432307 RepID=W9C408_SCLBF|nr:glycoside hydrolase family 18 protein [Sclerotinia borealis F-4128]